MLGLTPPTTAASSRQRGSAHSPLPSTPPGLHLNPILGSVFGRLWAPGHEEESTSQHRNDQKGCGLGFTFQLRAVRPTQPEEGGTQTWPLKQEPLCWPRGSGALHTGGPFAGRAWLCPQTPGGKACTRSPLLWAPVGSADAQGRSDLERPSPMWPAQDCVPHHTRMVLRPEDPAQCPGEMGLQGLRSSPSPLSRRNQNMVGGVS